MPAKHGLARTGAAQVETDRWGLEGLAEKPRSPAEALLGQGLDLVLERRPRQGGCRGLLNGTGFHLNFRPFQLASQIVGDLQDTLSHIRIKHQAGVIHNGFHVFPVGQVAIFILLQDLIDLQVLDEVTKQ